MSQQALDAVNAVRVREGFEPLTMDADHLVAFDQGAARGH